jgi:hypothetical protein
VFTAGLRGDHYVKIDFTGWKYFELVETESEKFSDYIWPGAEISSEEIVKDLFVYKVLYAYHPVSRKCTRFSCGIIIFPREKK